MSDDTEQTSAVPADAADSLAEEQQLTDHAEQAVKAALLALLLQSGASSSATSHALAVGPAALRSSLETTIKPLLFAVGLLMLRRSNRNNQPSSWHPLIDRVLDSTAEKAAEALAAAASRQGGDDRDFYERTTAGPDGAESWARQVSYSVVTSATESFKRGLANRLGFDYKRWVSRGDARVRETHRHLDGQTVHRNDYFKSQSGALLDRPGDTTAPIGEWINCRCDVLWLKGKHA